MTAAPATSPASGWHYFVVLIDHGRKTVFGHGYSTHVCVLRPLSRGTVTLQSADPAAHPLTVFNHLESPQDMRDLVDGVRLVRETLLSTAVGAPSDQEVIALR